MRCAGWVEAFAPARAARVASPAPLDCCSDVCGLPASGIADGVTRALVAPAGGGLPGCVTWARAAAEARPSAMARAVRTALKCGAPAGVARDVLACGRF